MNATLTVHRSPTSTHHHSPPPTTNHHLTQPTSKSYYVIAPAVMFFGVPIWVNYLIQTKVVWRTESIATLYCRSAATGMFSAASTAALLSPY